MSVIPIATPVESNIIGKIWGMCLQRQNQQSKGLLSVGYNTQLPLAGLVYKVSAAFSFKERISELISCHMVFQDWLPGRGLRVHLCSRLQHSVGVHSS